VGIQTLVSIYSQENQYKVIKSAQVHRQRISDYCTRWVLPGPCASCSLHRTPPPLTGMLGMGRYVSGEDVLALSANVDFPPCMLMRRMLEALLQIPRQSVGDVLKCPHLLDSLAECDPTAAATPAPEHLQPQQGPCVAPQHTQQPQGESQPAASPLPHPCPTPTPNVSGAVGTQGVSRAGGTQGVSGAGGRADQGGQTVAVGEAASLSGPRLRGRQAASSLVQRLQRDVVRCVLADCSYSPYSDVAKLAAGLEYELLLEQQLRAAGIAAFWTEAELRSQGCFKTPDIRLQVPFAVRRPQQQGGGRWPWPGTPQLGGVHDPCHVVTWIDSKATFGDDRMHSKQLEEQYNTYVNRYGPGLVIYWFGFIEDLNTDANVLLLDRFPTAAEMVLLH
ncbi:hypothetical protein QJQ45_028291, partial [Haematococcus lacustris]